MTKQLKLLCTLVVLGLFSSVAVCLVDYHGVILFASINITILIVLIILIRNLHLGALRELPLIPKLQGNLESANETIALLKTVLDNLDMAVWLRNTELDIIYFNKNYSEIAFNTDIAVDSAAFEIDKFAKKNAVTVLNTKEATCEERYLTIDGKRYLYQFIDAIVPHKNLIISTGYDVSSKDKISKELQLNIQAQADLLESTSNASAIFGTDRKLKFFNQAFAKLWGLDESFLDSSPSYENILDKLYNLRRLPEQANYSRFRKEQLQLFTNLTGTYNDFFYLPDGRSIRVIVIPHSLGNLIFSYEDMTDRIALESSYNTLLGVQQATLSNLHEAICVFGENGRLTLYNPKFALLWNLSDDFINSGPLLSTLLEQYQFLFKSDNHFEEHKQQMISGYIRRKSFKETIERKDHTFINRIMVPLPDGATLISDLDITYSVVAERVLRERNKALEDADRIKTEFLTNVSYELRSPLTSIMGYAEMISRKYVGDLSDKQQAYIGYIVTSGQKLANLIDDVMDLTIVEAGQIELEYTNFDVIESIQNTIAILSSGLHPFEINYDLNKSYFIVGDERRFRQVIFKLLCNSIEYSDQGRAITIDVNLDKKYCTVTIFDQGKGIPVDDQKYIFDKFYQAGNTKTMGRSGTGLGLSIVKKFVELHGGEIEFTSNEDVGSSFTCKFPLKKPN